MKNFRRALRDALRFWPLLLLATLCSVGNGALWGGNIGALFPVIEVTIAGKPLQSWIRQKISDGEENVADLQQQIGAIEKPGSALDSDQQLEIELLSARMAAEQAAIASSRRFQPWIDKYLPHDAFQTVLLVVLLLLAGTVLKHVFQLANTYLVALVAERIGRDIRRRVFSTALAMDQGGFAVHGSGGFMAHVTYSTEMLSRGVTSVFGGAVREPLKLMFCLIGASLICWRLLLLCLIVVPLVALLIITLSRALKRICRQLLERATGLHHVMLEALGNIRTVQAYTKEEQEQQRFDKATLDIQRFSVRLVLMNALTRPITEILAFGMLGTSIVVGAYLITNRATAIWGIQLTDRPLSVAAMLVFFGMLVGASDPIRKLSTVFAGINTGVVAADALYPVLERPSQIRDPADPRTVSKPHKTLRFDRVSFAYDGENQILRDVSVDLPFGCTVAIVGPNGAGKSSFVNLICRFYDPQSGSVSLDGIALHDMNLRDLRERIGLVTQNTELFNESVLYNIGYGAGHASRDEIIAAAKTAYAHEFITQELPDQYATVIGQHGQRLSGGQRQRIALARAILRDPEILILDEATSQVDVDSEQLIHKALEQLARHRTMIFVTHRQTMLEMADLVIRFERGSIVIEATHRAGAA